jgi:hypothetical protein
LARRERRGGREGGRERGEGERRRGREEREAKEVGEKKGRNEDTSNEHGVGNLSARCTRSRQIASERLRMTHTHRDCA